MQRLDVLITDHVRNQVAALVEAAADEGVTVDADQQRQIERLCAASSLALRVLQKQPGALARVLEPRATTQRRRRILLNERLPHPAESAEGSSFRDEMNALRQAHRIEMIRIGLHHLAYQEHDIIDLAHDLSDLADTILNRTFILTAREVERERGPSPKGSAMAVFALGKLGGEELNFSSDIDLMFVHRAERHSEAAEKWYEQQAILLSNTLEERTPYGFLYRVDTRLRPEGTRGALVPSFAAVETYYHTFGEDWERQALLKLRPVAGDATLCKDVAKLLEPFTYRKYIDEVEIADTLRTMDNIRRRMGERYKLDQQRQRDVKIRRGGIRDIEFITQAIQVLYGGQYPEVRVPGTIPGLQRMFESGLMHSDDHRVLSEGYRMLRRVEHALQLREGQQVYQLPTDPDESHRVALVAGFNSSEEMMEALQATGNRVHQLYLGIFGRSEWEDRTSRLLEESTPSEEALNVLSEQNFRDPIAAWKRLQRLAQDPDHAYLNAKTKRRLQAILPRLLGYAGEEPEPDRCLQQFERILESVGSRSTFYDVMKDQPQAMQILVTVAGGSEFLTECLRRDPALVEILGRESFLRDDLTADILNEHLQELELAYSKESDAERLIRLRNRAELRVGHRFLLRLREVDQIAGELTVLAQFILNEMVLATRPGLALGEEDDFLIVALGKFGGGELNFGSDLDLVFLYGEPTTDLTVPASELYPRWIRDLMEFANQRSVRGTLYEIDLRLRPYGRSSPLIGTLDAMQRYFAEKAWFWERLAYSRARPVLGAQRWRDAFETWRIEAIFGPGLSAEDRIALKDMRERIEREKGYQVIKAAPGGLIDVEFASQAIALAYGKDYPELRWGDTCSLLQSAAQRGLIETQLAQDMIDGYRFLRDIENRIRLVKRASLDHLPETPEELDSLARRVIAKNSPNRTGRHFLSLLQETTSTLREGYTRILDSLP